MLSIRQYQEKIKTFSNLKKFIRIQKIVVMQEIVKQNKIIKQLYFRDKFFNNILIDLYKKNKAIDSSFFDAKKNKVPIKRNLYFIISDDNLSSINYYYDKLVVEYIKHNNKIADLYVVVGKRISTVLKEEGFNVIETIKGNESNNQKIYETIANKVIRGYKSLLFVSSAFIYFDLSKKLVQEKTLFPFSAKKFNFKKNTILKSLAAENKIIETIDINKSIWLKDIDSVAEKISVLAIREKSYYIMTQYKLDLKRREMQELDDKNKNIEEEINKINLKIQKHRKNSITNELLVNVVAFKLRSKKNGGG